MVSTFISFIGSNENLKDALAVTAKTYADTQVWTLTAITPTTFSVLGSRSGAVGTLVVGTAFECDDATFTIASGTFVVGDKFTVNIHNATMPRYVKKDELGKLVNFPGGAAADTSGEGTWLTPRRMFENLPKTLDAESSYGNLIDHFRSVIKSQDGFEGSSFGVNNFRNLDPDYGFGGAIREYNGNFPLLVSMLIQKDISPLSIIDFGEYQYRLAISSVDQFLNNELANFISTTPLTLSTISSTNAGIQSLLAKFEEVRASDEHLRQVFSDTTANVKYWPVTLPMMSVVAAVEPTIAFDHILGIDMIVHHDGHHSPVLGVELDFNRNLVNTIVTRFDGVKVGGFISEGMPSLPYKNQLWMQVSTGQLRAFVVTHEGSTTPTGAPGETWYNRSTNTLYQWDASSNEWVISSSGISSAWSIVTPSIIRTSLILAIEEKLFAGIHPAMSVKIDTSMYEADKEVEFAKYAAKYNLDMYAPYFDAANAFTWNYSQAVFDNVPIHTARWHQIYLAYFNRSGSLSTARPNLEPWKLLGYETQLAAEQALSIDWGQYADTTGTRLWTTSMWDFIRAQRPGLKICVDPATDILLPPYVSSSSGNASYALTNVIPADIDKGYKFGDWGPTEAAWRRSLEYFYGCARVHFKNDPLNFLDKVWGYTYFTGNNSPRLERSLMRPIGANDFKMHGEGLDVIVDRDATKHIKNSTGIVSLNFGTVKFVCSHVEDNVTIFDVTVDGALVGYVREGEAFSFTSGGFIFTDVVIEDLGKPFNLGDIIELEMEPNVVGLSPTAGSFVMVGSSATLTARRVLSGESASFSLNPVDATLTVNVAPAEPTYVLTGSTKTLPFSSIGVAGDPDQVLVAIENGGTSIARSTDGGATWTTITNSFASYAISWNGSYFLTVGDQNSQWAKSTDGITWTTGSFTEPAPSYYNSLSSSGLVWSPALNLWCAATGSEYADSDSFYIHSSTDGQTWTRHLVQSGNLFFQSIHWDSFNNRFLAIAEDSDDLSAHKIFSSTNGTSWSLLSRFDPDWSQPNTLMQLDANNFICVRWANSIATSTDGGVTWTYAFPNNNPDLKPSAAVAVNDTYVLQLRNDSIFQFETYTSTDGVTFTFNDLGISWGDDSRSYHGDGLNYGFLVGGTSLQIIRRVLV